MAEIISIKAKLVIAKSRREWGPYRTAVTIMDKLTLLQEMVDYTEIRTNSDDSTLDNIMKGMAIFDRVMQVADTEDLKETAKFYNSLLELELNEYQKILDGQESKYLLSDEILCGPSRGDSDSSGQPSQ